MISIEQCRKNCSLLENLSEEEVLDIRENLYGLGYLAIESFLRSKGGSKNLDWLLSNQEKDIP